MTITLDPDISLVAALWRFIEDGGNAAEFSKLRERVRCQGALRDAVTWRLWKHRKIACVTDPWPHFTLSGLSPMGVVRVVGQVCGSF